MWKNLLAALLFGVSLTPAFAQIEVTSELRHEYEVQPGTLVEGSFEIMNRTDEPQEAHIFVADYFFDYLDQYSYEEVDTHPRSNRSWITLPDEYVVVPPRSTITYSYIIHVPDELNPGKGTYWSVIMVEPARAFDPGGFVPSEEEKREVFIDRKIRYAVQVATHLPDPGKFDLTFFSPEVQRAPVDSLTGEQPFILQFDMENTGDRSLRPVVGVQLYDDKGNLVGEYEGVQITLYPGTSTRQRILLGPIAPGSYTAIVLADGGGDALFGTRIAVDV